jgi:hypothetical protein
VQCSPGSPFFFHFPNVYLLVRSEDAHIFREHRHRTAARPQKPWADHSGTSWCARLRLFQGLVAVPALLCYGSHIWDGIFYQSPYFDIYHFVSATATSPTTGR